MVRKQYDKERANINLAIPKELVEWLDEASSRAQVSRTWLIGHLLEIMRMQEGLKFLRIGREGISYRNITNEETVRGWMKPEFAALAGGMVFGTSMEANEAHLAESKRLEAEQVEGAA